MKILYIAHSTDGGGAGVALVNMAREMIAHGHEVYVVAPSDDCVVAQRLREIGATILVVSVCLTIYPRTKNLVKWVASLLLHFWKWSKAKKSIKRAIVDNKIELVHTNVGPLNLAPPICRKLGIPHVWHLREYQDLDFDMTFFPSKINFRRVIKEYGNYNIAITKGIYEYYNLRSDKDAVIYDGVISKQLYEKELPQQSQRDKVIILVGRIEKAKGMLDAIKAFVKFHQIHPEWRLQIVGSYNEESVYYKQCKHACENSDCAENVIFMGARNDVYDLMSNARILVMPSKSEGFGFVTVEGMANGCLVIARNTCGTKEQLDNGLALTGEEIALRFNSQEELLTQMCNAAENDYSSMIERARRTIFELYSKKKWAQTLESFYKYVMDDFYKR